MGSQEGNDKNSGVMGYPCPLSGLRNKKLRISTEISFFFYLMENFYDPQMRLPVPIQTAFSSDLNRNPPFKLLMVIKGRLAHAKGVCLVYGTFVSITS